METNSVFLEFNTCTNR